MNYPSRNDNTLGHEEWNQSPPPLPADGTTREDLNAIANRRIRRDHKAGSSASIDETGHTRDFAIESDRHFSNNMRTARTGVDPVSIDVSSPSNSHSQSPRSLEQSARMLEILKRYGEFIGPGFMIAVAYIDPGNYSTDVSAGAKYRFKLLFIILMANVFAIFLQSLCIKLGTVTGMNLAETCRAHLPRWLNIFLYILAEAAIVATDIAEVIGTAIALNLLINVPLVAGCAISIVDVLIILVFYNPSSTMRRVRYFEFFVAALVIGVMICFCYSLSLIEDTSVKEVFRGYVPSSAIVEADGLYLSCGILGATVMPHSLYLGSGIVQPRLKDFDIKSGFLIPDPDVDEADKAFYKPSVEAIRHCLWYSITELSISLFSFALFINSAILIVAGASLSSKASANDTDLFGIHALLSRTIAPVAGTVFALALLLSGTSAGIVATMAGQMVSEGALNWKLKPWIRRLVTRVISIIPAIIVAGAVGSSGLSAALNGTQVALSVALPFVSAPLIYFTCRSPYMTVRTDQGYDVKMQNHWITAFFAVLVWLVIVVMNVALLALVGLGKS